MKCILCGKKFKVEEYEGKFFASHVCSKDDSGNMLGSEYAFNYDGPMRRTPELALRAVPKRFRRANG